jgi:DNA invertase Pin-like site-specific DNA recombinase
MDINKMLAELRLEREQIEEAIMTMERLARGRGRRRGRPPSWMSQIKRRGRPPGSKNRPKNEPKGSTKVVAA